MTIVLVEDDVGIGRPIVQGLTAQGFTVAWQRVGAGLLDRLADPVCRTLILDVGLPDADGMALCRAVRAAGFGLPILMLTARGTLDDRLDGFAAGADDYLAKPFAFAELVSRVKVLVRRGEHLPANPLRWEGFELDPKAADARWQGQPLRIDPRSLQILTVLVEGRGTIVPRTSLIDRVWGVTTLVSDNAVDVAISTLRKRLSDAAVPFTVHSVRGQGLALAPVPVSRRPGPSA